MLASSEVKVSFPGVAALWGCGQLLVGIKYLRLTYHLKQEYEIQLFFRLQSYKKSELAEPENFLGLKTNPDLVKSNVGV